MDPKIEPLMLLRPGDVESYAACLGLEFADRHETVVLVEKVAFAPAEL